MEECGRIRSRGNLCSCRSACRRCCQRRPYATSPGVDPGPFRPFPSTGSWPWNRRIWVSPPRLDCCQCELDEEKKKKENSCSLLPLPLSVRLCALNVMSYGPKKQWGGACRKGNSDRINKIIFIIFY